MKLDMHHSVKLPYALELLCLVAVLGISAWAILFVLSYVIAGLFKLLGF